MLNWAWPQLIFFHRVDITRMNLIRNWKVLNYMSDTSIQFPFKRHLSAKVKSKYIRCNAAQKMKFSIKDFFS